MSAWNADAMYDGNVEDMFFNTMVAYYMICSNVAIMMEKHGKDWEKHFIPRATFVNSASTMGSFAIRCMSWPVYIPFLQGNLREWIVETFFSQAKLSSKGTPRMKDMIYGTLAQRIPI